MKMYPIVLLIGGSNGKTTMKELIAHLLQSAGEKVAKTEANFNNQVGLPKTLLKVRAGDKFAILEAGTNHPGEMEWLTKVAEPNCGMLTNIGREHLEFFKNIRGVVKEELALFDVLRECKGIAFINTDDKYIAPQLLRHGSIGRPYGTISGFRAHGLRYTPGGKLKILVQMRGGFFTYNSNLIGDYTPSLVVGAVCVADCYDMTQRQIRKALATFKPFPKRMEVVKLQKGVIGINDTYNANPESFLSALETLKKIPAKGKKYVIAGDMFELGEASEQEHKLLGKTMAKYKFDGYYFTGKEMKQAFAVLVNSNKKLNASYDSSKEDIINALHSILKRGDVILVKGSRGMKMEDVIEELRIGN
jgi:UDP-N-acetylmuramoyl-tripeptide--D-alanyl-D-alanine ligase